MRVRLLFCQYIVKCSLKPYLCWNHCIFSSMFHLLTLWPWPRWESHINTVLSSVTLNTASLPGPGGSRNIYWGLSHKVGSPWISHGKYTVKICIPLYSWLNILCRGLNSFFVFSRQSFVYCLLWDCKRMVKRFAFQWLWSKEIGTAKIILGLTKIYLVG